MFDTEFLRFTHIGLVAFSLAGFAMRALWMLGRSDLLHAKVTRVFPHIVDTFLLLSGVLLAWQLALSPLEHTWLAAKLIALVGYIISGAVALHHGRSRRQQLLALVIAVMFAIYMLATALHHQVWPF